MSEAIDDAAAPELVAAEQAVPYARFSKVASERRALAAQVEALQIEARAYAAGADELVALRAERTSWAEERELMGQGVTDAEGIDLARHYYGKLPVDQKPKTIGEYVSSLRAEGAVVPRGLAAFVAPPAVAVAAAPADQQYASRVMPRSTATGTAPPAAPTVTADALRSAREQAQRSGNWEPVKAIQAAYAQQVASRR